MRKRLRSLTKRRFNESRNTIFLSDVLNYMVNDLDPSLGEYLSEEKKIQIADIIQTYEMSYVPMIQEKDGTTVDIYRTDKQLLIADVGDFFIVVFANEEFKKIREIRNDVIR